ncbi:hypothetical protein RGD00_22400, partial [Xinfangfangia sp. LG-4]|nr:hypothetical protein [Xinfangfangia sp. LG-4]
LVRRLAHDAPSYSGVGASGKPGAVHFDAFLWFRVAEAHECRQQPATATYERAPAMTGNPGTA